MIQKSPPFEAKYINIKWADRSSALSINESTDPIPIEIIDSANFELEAITFTKRFGQLAFKFVGDFPISQESVYFTKANGEKSFLIPVTDNLTKNVWWVEGEEWSKSNKRWQSEIFRSAGKINFNFGRYFCVIKIRSCSFTYDQLENYLQDFKNDLWYLVLHETSYISAPVREKKLSILDESAIDYFNHFINYAVKIIENPKSELREVQELKNLKQVRPTPRTFMEIATTGYKKQHTSRAYKASYNVPENQYVLFIINRLSRLIKNMDKVTSYVSLSLSERKETQEERIASFSNKIKINRDAVVSDYKELRAKHESEVNNLSLARNEQNPVSVVFEEVFFTVTLGGQIASYKFFLAFYVKSQEGLIELQGEDYYIFLFKTSFNGALSSGSTYKIKAKITIKRHPNKDDSKTCHELKILYIESIETIRSITKINLEKLTNEAIFLSENNWERDITKEERKEQEQEISKIKIDIEKISIRESRNLQASTRIAPALKKIEVLQKQFSALNIRPNSLLPSSMSFIQNPNYQGVHKLYKEIQSLSGVDEQLFLGLEKAENIGILNISLIYERWCLLQIIKILIDKFRFLPEQNWKDSLLNQIVNSDPSKVRDVRISFENKDTCRQITLWYEKELPIDEGRKFPRRADFVIDIVSNFDPNNIVSKRIVLDAKFYENINEMGGISKVINSLYNEKNYSGSGKNKVFILHPSPMSILKTKTPQKWAEDNFLGESQMFDWDDEFPNHKYGAVLLSPVRNKGDYLESLQMCIGLSLQYGLEDNALESSDYDASVRSQANIFAEMGINPIPKEKVFCLICGGSDLGLSVKQTVSNLGLKWTQVCNSCNHETLYNYCFSKGCRARLIKHGIYWTYHATQSLQPYNIKCPSCGTIVPSRE